MEASILMNFDEILRSRIHRILKGLSRYSSLANESVIPQDFGEHLLAQDEKVLGIYENSLEDITSNIFITTVGLYIFSNGWKRLEYGNIASAYVPLGENFDKTLANTLVIRLRSGGDISFRILGEKGKTREIWDLLRFVDRIREDFWKRHSNG